MKTELVIENMSCNHCVASVKTVLEALPEVRSAEVTVGHAVLESEGALSLDVIAKALDEEGYRLAQ
ncbi:MAG: cation transporter [Deltaproteobacteria bacterium]|nr:cation transporter [Deltaproteobacteria bacterium]